MVLLLVLAVTFQQQERFVDLLAMVQIKAENFPWLSWYQN